MRPLHGEAVVYDECGKGHLHNGSVEQIVAFQSTIGQFRGNIIQYNKNVKKNLGKKSQRKNKSNGSLFAH